LLGVGVEAGLEIVDDGEEGPLLRGGDVHLPPFLLEPELGVVDFLSLSGIARDHQDLGHCGARGGARTWPVSTIDPDNLTSGSRSRNRRLAAEGRGGKAASSASLDPPGS